jgi:hypothetical protein
MSSSTTTSTTSTENIDYIKLRDATDKAAEIFRKKELEDTEKKAISETSTKKITTDTDYKNKIIKWVIYGGIILVIIVIIIVIIILIIRSISNTQPSQSTMISTSSQQLPPIFRQPQPPVFNQPQPPVFRQPQPPVFNHPQPPQVFRQPQPSQVFRQPQPPVFNQPPSQVFNQPPSQVFKPQPLPPIIPLSSQIIPSTSPTTTSPIIPSSSLFNKRMTTTESDTSSFNPFSDNTSFFKKNFSEFNSFSPVETSNPLNLKQPLKGGNRKKK